MVRKRFDVYFSLEASLLLPLIILVIWLIILTGFYLYNVHCIHQITSIGALRGAGMKRESREEIKQYLEEEIEKMIRERLVMMEEINYQVKIDTQNVEVKVDGTMHFPVFSILKDSLKLWEISADSRYKREDPVDSIRRMRLVGAT